MLNTLRDFAHRLTKSHKFEYFIVGLILLNAVLVGWRPCPG